MGAERSTAAELEAFFAAEWEEHAAVAAAARDGLQQPFARLVEVCRRSLAAGGKLMFFGNGGSSADAQHLAAELTVRYAARRPPLAAVALAADAPTLTATANDYAFEEVFARQIRALGRPGDAAVAISTSGRSASVIAGLRAAREMGLGAAALGGRDGGELNGLADPLLIVPASSTARIQEMHIVLGHMLCAALEREPGLG